METIFQLTRYQMFPALNLGQTGVTVETRHYGEVVFFVLYSDEAYRAARATLSQFNYFRLRQLIKARRFIFASNPPSPYSPACMKTVLIALRLAIPFESQTEDPIHSDLKPRPRAAVPDLTLEQATQNTTPTS